MELNENIETLFTGFKVDNVTIPIAFMQYIAKNGEPYIVYSQVDKANSYSSDDEVRGYVTFYDFDIYGKGNLLHIIKAVINKLVGAGWTYEPSRDSGDLYEVDTKYFHKTLCFAYPVQIINEEVNNNEQ